MGGFVTEARRAGRRKALISLAAIIPDWTLASPSKQVLALDRKQAVQTGERPSLLSRQWWHWWIPSPQAPLCSEILMSVYRFSTVFMPIN